ncbi:MAG: PAS domain-containing protein, partial [bacterium]
MVSRRFYLNLILRVCSIALSCLLLILSIFYFPNYSLIIILSGLFIYLVVELIRYNNKINRKLEDFFIAHLSGEVTSSFIRSGREEEFKKLYHYFDELNIKLEKSRVENEISNTYFKTLVDHAAVGLIAFSDEGRIEFINDAARKIFGIHVLKTLARLDQYKEGLSEHLMILTSHHTELVTVIINGELIQLATRKVQFLTGEKNIHLVSLQNIKPELEQKEIESWQRLIRVLTHEIMNSITPITSLVDSLTRIFREKESGYIRRPEEISSNSIEKTLKGLDLVLGRGSRLIQFVENYREVTKLPKPNFAMLNLRDLLLQVAALEENTESQHTVPIIVDCDPDLILQADSGLMEQVLINLVKNAIEVLSALENPRIIITGKSLY